MNDFAEVIIKKQNSDFHVNEIPFAHVYGEGIHSIYNLSKVGLSTNDAISKIAAYAGCTVQDITYSGLKDEEGITTQQISLPFIIEPQKLQTINNTQDIFLIYQGNTNNSLQIGHLHGNTFKVIVRNLSVALSEKLQCITSFKSVFINYYGTQRFGIPNAKKTTHIIGEHLLNSQYSQAMSLLIEQQPNNAKFIEFVEKPEEYFSQIDIRQCAFFLSSYYSYKWNEELSTKLRGMSIELIEQINEGISYLYIKDKNEKLEAMSKLFEMDLYKFRAIDNKAEKILSSRQAFINYEVLVGEVKNDEFNSGKKSVELRFAIPSGCYATMLVPQFLYEIS